MTARITPYQTSCLSLYTSWLDSQRNGINTSIDDVHESAGSAKKWMEHCAVCGWDSSGREIYEMLFA